MNFLPTEDQTQIADSVRRFLAKHVDFAQRRAMVASADGRSAAAWQGMAALGITGLGIAEAHGGMGDDTSTLATVGLEMGRALAIEPFLSSTVLGTTALKTAADEAARAKYLPDVAAGQCVLAWAHDEAAGGDAPRWIETRAQQVAGAGWTLHGNKIHVLNGQLADRIVVSARHRGGATDADGVALFLINPRAAGVHLRPYRLVDDSLACELTLDGADAEPLGDPHDAAHALRAINITHRTGIAVACNDALGTMQEAYALAVEYLGIRKQFGRFIGENQALRHSAAEMLVALQMATSMAMLAEATLANVDTNAAELDLLRCKLVVAQHGRVVCQAAVQMHGGIGMTEEHKVAHCLRRMTVFEQLLGSTAACRNTLAARLDSQTTVTP